MLITAPFTRPAESYAGSAISDIFMNLTCVFSFHDPSALICARFYASVMDEGLDGCVSALF